MNELTSKLCEQYRPVLAVVVYKQEFSSGYGQAPYYLEGHDILPDGAIGAGSPLQHDTLLGIAESLGKKIASDGNLEGDVPESLLYFGKLPGGKYKMIWYRPACKQMVFFTKGTGLKSGKCMVPATVFVAESGKLNVYCTAANDRPSAVTKIMMAPYYNVSDSGNMCLGSANVPIPRKKTFTAIIDYWEAMFWQSEFSHESGSNEKVTGGKLPSVWKSQLANPNRPFDTDLLKPHKRGKKILTFKDLTA